jgi:hypothetical protein
MLGIKKPVSASKMAEAFIDNTGTRERVTLRVNRFWEIWLGADFRTYACRVGTYT